MSWHLAIHSYSKCFRHCSEEGLAREAATDFPWNCLLSVTCHTTVICAYGSSALRDLHMYIPTYISNKQRSTLYESHTPHHRIDRKGNMSSSTCTKQRCDLRSRTTRIFATLSVDPDFDKSISSFAKWTQQPCAWTGIKGARLPSKLIEFPSDITTRETLHSIDPTLEDRYIANLVDFAEDKSCRLTAADLAQMGNSVLDDKSLRVSLDVADSTLAEFRETGILDNPQITEDTLETIQGRLVRLGDGQVGILHKYETECSRGYCPTRTFEEGQSVVSYADGWGHTPQSIAALGIGPLPLYTGTCGTCARPFITHSLIFTHWLGGNPKHVSVLDGFSDTCQRVTHGE
jgi:hypothetical protein